MSKNYELAPESLRDTLVGRRYRYVNLIMHKIKEQGIETVIQLWNSDPEKLFNRN